MGNCFSVRVKHVSGLSSSGRTTAGEISTGKSSNNAKQQLQSGGGSQNLSPFQTRAPEAGSSGSMQLHHFTYADLRAATRNFRPDSFLGEGGFGSVFKGHIDERTFQPARPGQGILIAVKKLNPEGLQGHKEWLAELYFLGALHHPNLVKLIGYCSEDEHRLLVYEFMPRGSLENHLFGRSRNTISWSIRLKIAIDAAQGLAFLHDATRPVIYRDFKSSNILLDSDFNAKLSDFGLAKDGPTGDKSHVTTRVMGTYGYAAPEYVATGRLTAKSDVYGFGVVLLEILTGRRAVDKKQPGGEQNLVEWAAPYLTDKRKWSRVLDQKLDGQYSLKGAQKAANIALQCLSQDPKMRPTMKEVVESLGPLLNPKDLSKISISNNSSIHTTTKQDNNKLVHTTTKQENIKHASITTKEENAKLARTPIPHKLSPIHNQSIPEKPLDAFKLPSPKEGFGRRGNTNALPCPSPTRGSPLVQRQ